MTVTEENRLARNEYMRNYYRQNRDRLYQSQKDRRQARIDKDPEAYWAARKAYHERVRDVRNEKLRALRKENPEPFREADRKRRERDPEMPRRKRLRQHFGLTVAQYDAMLAAQGGCCAACGEEPKSRLMGKTLISLAVDHDHATGKVRGLLCSNCNVSLGMLKDDVAKLQALIEVS